MNFFNRIDRFIIKKFLSTFVFMVLVILLIITVIDVAEKMDDFIEKAPPMSSILKYYLNFQFSYGNLLSPICVFLAVIYFTTRLTNNLEIVALLSSGVNFYRVMAPYLFSAFVIGLVSFFLNAYLVPVATKERVDFEYNVMRDARIMRESNIHKTESYDPDTDTRRMIYFFTYSPDEKEGYIFNMDVYRSNTLVEAVHGSSAEYIDSIGKWRVYNPVVHIFDTDSSQVLKNDKTPLELELLLTPDDIYVKDMRAESMPLDELDRNIDLEAKRRNRALEAELRRERHERYAYPFASLILTLIGFAISTRKRRGGIALQIGIGLVVAFAYVLLVMAGPSLVGDSLPDWLGIWMPNMVFFVIGMIMLRLAPK